MGKRMNDGGENEGMHAIARFCTRIPCTGSLTHLPGLQVVLPSHVPWRPSRNTHDVPDAAGGYWHAPVAEMQAPGNCWQVLGELHT